MNEIDFQLAMMLAATVGVVLVSIILVTVVAIWKLMHDIADEIDSDDDAEATDD